MFLLLPENGKSRFPVTHPLSKYSTTAHLGAPEGNNVLPLDYSIDLGNTDADNHHLQQLPAPSQLAPSVGPGILPSTLDLRFGCLSTPVIGALDPGNISVYRYRSIFQ